MYIHKKRDKKWVCALWVRRRRWRKKKFVINENLESVHSHLLICIDIFFFSSSVSISFLYERYVSRNKAVLSQPHLWNGILSATVAAVRRQFVYKIRNISKYKFYTLFAFLFFVSFNHFDLVWLLARSHTCLLASYPQSTDHEVVRVYNKWFIFLYSFSFLFARLHLLRLNSKIALEIFHTKCNHKL